VKRKRGNGEGNLRRRGDGLWEARYCVVDDGKQSRRSVYGRTRDEVARKLRAALKARDDGAPQPVGRETVAAFLARWMQGATLSLRPPSVRRYRSALDTHIVPALGARRLRELGPQHVQAFYVHLTEEGLSPATVRLVHFVLHRAIDQAVRWGLVVRNVADLVDIPKLSPTEAAVLTPDQVRAVVRAAQGDALEPLMIVALTTGLRRGELIALRWDAVSLDERRLDVTGTMQPNGVVAEPKSWSSRRRVPLGDLAINALRSHRAARIEQLIGYGAPWDDHAYVYGDELGRPLAPMTLLRHWYAALAAAGIPRMPFHATRHSAATLMLAAGVSPRVAAERLGHRTAALTLDRYSHVTEGLRHDAARAIDGLLVTPATA
jgi:integrase